MRISFDVDEKRVTSLFCSAIEGGSNYWVKSVSAMPGSKGEFLSDQMIEGFNLTDGETGEVHYVSRKDIENALKLFAALEPKRHFAAWLSENDDAETADVFLQLCVFGEVIYG
jgi:hypothetical protein